MLLFCDIAFLNFSLQKLITVHVHITLHKKKTKNLFICLKSKKKKNGHYSKQKKIGENTRVIVVQLHIISIICHYIASGYNNFIHIFQKFLILQQDCHNGP